MVLQKDLALIQTRSTLGIENSKIRNERQNVFELVRQLVQAQFERADQELSKRLWQDVVDKGIDIDRVINLMYRCSFHDDDIEMTEIDQSYKESGLIG